MELALYAEVCLFCIVLLLLIYTRMRRGFDQRSYVVLFRRVLSSNIFLFVLDAVWVYTNSAAIRFPLLFLIVNALYFAQTGIVGYFWFCYSETLQRSGILRSSKGRFLSLVPLSILALLSLVSIKTGWLFSVSADGHYARGPLYFVQALIAYGYIAFTAGKALYIATHTRSYPRRMEYRTLAAYLIPSFLLGIAQIFTFRMPLMCVGNTLGALVAFINFQDQMISVDPLTKLNNRNHMMHVLSHGIGCYDEKESASLYLVIMDVDYFKHINDHYGHVEGDAALVRVANALRTACRSPDCSLFRYGGDEFILLCRARKNERIPMLCERIHETLHRLNEQANAPYHLSLSIGTAPYSSRYKNVQQWIEAADRALYEVKRNRA